MRSYYLPDQLSELTENLGGGFVTGTGGEGNQFLQLNPAKWFRILLEAYASCYLFADFAMASSFRFTNSMLDRRRYSAGVKPT